MEPVDDMDQQPWNADLLDWLASDFADHGYDLKHLLRPRSYLANVPVACSAFEPRKKTKDFVFRGPFAPPIDG